MTDFRSNLTLSFSCGYVNFELKPAPQVSRKY